MKILITGSCGFIGHHLSINLLNSNNTIIGIDNLNSIIYDKEYKLIKYRELIKYENYIHIENDISSENYIEKYNPDIVIHLAAYANVRKSYEIPDKVLNNNLVVTTKLLNDIKNHESNPLFIYASSSSVYGKNKKVPFNENDELNNIISPYALSKKMCEDIVSLYCKNGLRAIGLRFFIVYGPGCRPDMAVYKFINNIYNGKPITMFGDGTMQRDFTYITDIIDGILSCIKLKLSENEHRIYNLGNNTPIELKHFISLCENTIGKKANIINKEIPEGDVPITYADITKANKELNYNPKVKLEEGLKITFKWILKNIINNK